MTDLNVDEYRTLYVAESRENHENIISNLLELERGDDTENGIREVFRSAHSLKGMSAFMGFDNMEAICHALEDVFSEIRNGTLEVTHGLMDTLLVGVDDIEMMLDDIENGGSGLLPDKEAHVAALKAWIHIDNNPAPTTQGFTSPSLISTEQESTLEPASPSISSPVPSSLPSPTPSSVSAIALPSSFEEDGMAFLYAIAIQLAPDVDSANLRSMLLLQSLESFGTIISTSPVREIIEDDETFAGSFEITMVSDAGQSSIEPLLTAPHIVAYTIQQISASNLSSPSPSQVSSLTPSSVQETLSTPLPSTKNTRYIFSISIDDSVDSKNLRSMVLLCNFEVLSTIISMSPDREIIEDDPSFSGTFTLIIDSVLDRTAFDSLLSSSDIAHYTIQCDETQEKDLKKISADDIKPHFASKTDADLSPPSPARPASPEFQPIAPREEKTRDMKNIRVGIDRLDQMMNLVEDLVINRGRLEQIARNHNIKELDETLTMVGRSVTKLQDMMMGIRMIPIRQTFNRFPRSVRDIATRHHKEVEFIMKGGETELDRSVMEGLHDPLLHLIRNALDHGIEPPDVRIAQGKDPKGTLTLAAFRDKDNVVIIVEDDGAGMDPDKIRKKALEKAVISQEALLEMSDEEVLNLVFYPGFSTADTITDISGRGVGLDVVKAIITDLQGSINLISERGKGSRFELVLPPTMAIVMVMMVEINKRRCAIPIINIAEVANLSTFPIQQIGHDEGILLRDELVWVCRLSDMFGCSEHEEIIVIIQSHDKKGAIIVDLLEGQQEVVIKPLSPFIGNCAGISGVTISGDGDIVPVLDVNDILTEYGK